MKSILLIAPLTAAALLTGCDPGSQSNPSTESRPAAQDAKEKVKAAATATNDYLAAARDEFVTTMNQRLTELDARVAELVKKSEGYKDEAKAQADLTLAALKEQRAKMNEKLEAFKKTGADAWKDMKAGLATAMDDLEKACDNARAKFN